LEKPWLAHVVTTSHWKKVVPDKAFFEQMPNDVWIVVFSPLIFLQKLSIVVIMNLAQVWLHKVDEHISFNGQEHIRLVP
jgi:hypothetical protein